MAAAFDSFNSQLPDFSEVERLGQDVDTTFETTKIYAWGDDPDGDGFRELVPIYEVIDPDHFYPTIKAAVRAFREEAANDAAPPPPMAQSQP